MKKNKKFDSVEMKHKAAEKIQKKLSRMNTQQQIAFWKTQTDALRKQQQKKRKDFSIA